MSLLSSFLEDHEWDFKQMERMMQRQMQLLDRHLQELREELLPCCPCGHLPPPSCLCSWSRTAPSRAVMATRDVERDLASVRRKLNRMCNSSQDRKVLAVMDVKGFDPEEVTVTVKDRKVQVLAEHEEAHTTTRGKEYNYKKLRKEITLPPGDQKALSDHVSSSVIPQISTQSVTSREESSLDVKTSGQSRGTKGQLEGLPVGTDKHSLYPG